MTEQAQQDIEISTVRGPNHIFVPANAINTIATNMDVQLSFGVVTNDPQRGAMMEHLVTICLPLHAWSHIKAAIAGLEPPTSQ